jgi:hypothetical protein
VFEITGSGFDEDGNRTRLTITVCPADRNLLPAPRSPASMA